MSGDRLGDAANAVVTGDRKGWVAVLVGVYQGISVDRIFLIAAGVTFYAILALFPGIGALVSVYGLFADPGAIAAQLDTLSGVAPSGATAVIHDQLVRLAQQNGAALGMGFVLGLAGAVWFTNSGMIGLFTALNAVYETAEQRGLFRYYATTLAFTTGAIVVVVLSIGATVVIPIILHFVPSATITALLLDIMRWPLLFVLSAAALAAVYRYGPCRPAPQWRWIVVSSVLAALAWLGASAIFSWYVGNFGRYNQTYGSLGAIFGFMTWMWLSLIVVLLGAKLNAELERHFRR